MQNENTRFIFNEQGIFISPDIMPLFYFLKEIEKEVESLLGFNKQLDGIRASHLEMLRFTQFLAEKLKENNIDFKFVFKEHPEKVAGKLEFYIPLRSQIIVLFASLDVLFNLHMSYEHETVDEDLLRKLTMDTDNTKKFLNEFLLTEGNSYYKENKQRLSKIDSSKLRDLRNALTHFFSVGKGGLSLSPSFLKERARKFENILKQNKYGNVVFISEEDLYGLIKQANLLRMRKWSIEFETDPTEFKRKIRNVVDLVKAHGAKVVLNKDLHF